MYSGRLIEECLALVEAAEGKITLSQARRFLADVPEPDEDDLAAELHFDA